MKGVILLLYVNNILLANIMPGNAILRPSARDVKTKLMNKYRTTDLGPISTSYNTVTRAMKFNYKEVPKDPQEHDNSGDSWGLTILSTAGLRRQEETLLNKKKLYHCVTMKFMPE